MSSAIEFDIDIARLLQKLDRAPHLVYDEMQLGLREFAAKFERGFARSRLRNDWKTHSGDGVARRTGTLARTLSSRVKGKTIHALQAVIKIGGGAAKKYAWMQEKGNTRDIVPVKAKRLKIPLKAALTSAGVIKKSARGRMDILFGKKVAGKHRLFLGHKAKTKRGKNRYLFLLAERIPAGRIKARLGFYDYWATFREKEGARTVRRMARRLTARLRKE